MDKIFNKTLDKLIELTSRVDLLESEKGNLTRTLEECGEIISKAKNIVDWLLVHNKNYTKQQYYKIQELKDLLEGE